MKKVLLFIAPLFIAVLIFFGILFFLERKSGKGALQVTSVPKSTVFLNGKPLGDTPLCKCEDNDMLEAGEYTLKLIPTSGDFEPFENKITINKGTLSVADRTFGPLGESEGSIIALSPIPEKEDSQLLVLSFPDKAAVSLDSNPSGISPVLLKNVTESDHNLHLAKEGYREKILRIKTVAGYKLISLVFLGINPEIVSASPASDLKPPAIQKIVILDTPVGFLRVREDASLGSSQIGQVRPKDTFDLLDEKDGWFKIKFSDEKVGWVSSDYAKKQ